MSTAPKNLNLYNKALEIFKLSRHVSSYLIDDLAHLDAQGNEHEAVYFTGDIIRHSDALAPEILKIENQAFQDDRIRHARGLELLTHRLYKTCERLERAESSGRDFVVMLRSELKKFRRMQHSWIVTL